MSLLELLTTQSPPQIIIIFKNNILQPVRLLIPFKVPTCGVKLILTREILIIQALLTVNKVLGFFISLQVYAPWVFLLRYSVNTCIEDDPDQCFR